LEALQFTEEDHASLVVMNNLFPLYQPEPETEIYIKVDIDSLSFTCGSLIKLAWIHSSEGRQFEFFSNFDRWVDRTTKSRFNIRCDNQYQPTVRNKKRNLFGFEMLRNLKICKMKCGTIDFVLSMHLLDHNKVGQSMFWDTLCGAVCLAMNTALLHPDWITGATQMAGMSEYREGTKNIEKFFVTKEGRRAFHSVDCVVGAKLLMFFQTALVQYSEQTVDQYQHNGEFHGRKIHRPCYHGLPKYPEARLACIKDLLEASTYIVQNCTWSCVAAGLKSKLKSEEKMFKFGECQQIRDFIQFERMELQQRVEDLFEDPASSPEGDNLFLPQNLIFQHDVGIEVRPVDENTNFYPHGPKSAEIVKKNVDGISQAELAELMGHNMEQGQVEEEKQEENNGVEDNGDGEFEDVEGIDDDDNEAVQPFEEEPEEGGGDNAMNGVENLLVNEQSLSPSKFLRYPFHLTTGMLANTHVMDLQLQVIITHHVDQENNLWVRTEVRLKNGTRVVQGMQIYSPRERALLSRRSREITHLDLNGYSALTQRLLDPTTSRWQSDMDVAKIQQSLRKLTVRSKEILEGYNDFHSGAYNGRAEVRFEYAFACNEWSKGEGNYPALPLDPNDTNLWPFDAIVMAQKDDVSSDIEQLHTYAMGPMEALSHMDPQNIANLSPAIKTAFVHMAEIVQQMVNSTDPGIQGTHRTIVKRGWVEDYARVSVPGAHRTILDTNTRNFTKLPFGLNPRLLPLAPEFSEQYQTRPGHDSSPGFFLHLIKERVAKLQNPAVFTLIQKRLGMMICRICHGIEPGSGVPIPGVMEGTDFGKWIDLVETDKSDAMRLLGVWQKEIYDDEFNFLIRKALEQKKNHGPSEQLLQYLVTQKRSFNWQIKTVADMVNLTTLFQNLDGFLDCHQPLNQMVTRKGKFSLRKIHMTCDMRFLFPPFIL
jgi:hypothetical protein